MTIDFSKIAAGVTVASSDDFPSTQVARRRQADPALVKLVQEAAQDGKRRELVDRFSTKPYEGRKGASEYGTVAGELHRAAREAGVKIQVRKFDADANSARLTFKVTK